MDPNETLTELLKSINNDDREEAIEHLENLADWLKKGGFMPELIQSNVEEVTFKFMYENQNKAVFFIGEVE
jgi:predicted Zn-ribbon and HTH transcriptional regulator